MDIGSVIARKRKELGFTQSELASRLNITPQAVSKWESGTTMPDITILGELAQILDTSVDMLVGHNSQPKTEYEEKYRGDRYYWGIAPNRMCYEIMKLCPPTKPYRVLDIGCGEGQNAVFFARNGYDVTAFDISDAGLDKVRRLAAASGVNVKLFKADINEYEPCGEYDIVFSSGVLHYLNESRRGIFFDKLKPATSCGGIHVLNVFVQKPFIALPPDFEQSEKQTAPWYSGDLLRYYHDWYIHSCGETVFECNSGGKPHRHCMDTVVVKRME